jgi:hypothetical protein
MGAAEYVDGVDAEVSGLRGGLCGDCYGRGDFGFNGSALEVAGAGVVRGDAGLVGGEASVAYRSWLERHLL